MVHIKTSLFPYRLVLTRREPVQLSVDVVNNDAEEKTFSIEIEVPRTLGLERAGAKIQDFKKFGPLAPGQEKHLVYDIHGKSSADDTTYPITIMVHEHRAQTNDVARTVTKRVELTVQSR